MRQAKPEPQSGSVSVPAPLSGPLSVPANSFGGAGRGVSKSPQPKIVEKYLNPAWQARNEKDLQEMSESHEKLINLILSEEEELIASHRMHIDMMVGIVKGEMGILHDVDQPGSDVEQYTSTLKNLLDQQVACIAGIQEKLETFNSHLKLEEEMNKKFYKFQSEILDLHDN